MPEITAETITLVELFSAQAKAGAKHWFEVHRSPRPEPGQAEPGQAQPEPLHTSPPRFDTYGEAITAGLAYAEAQGWQPII